MKEFIEKLIGRLEELRQRNSEIEGIDSQSRSKAYANVVKIVNKLAEEHESDYCEWNRQDESNFYLHKTSCGTEDTYDDGYVFCPYCGKKIKVVE